VNEAKQSNFWAREDLIRKGMSELNYAGPIPFSLIFISEGPLSIISSISQKITKRIEPCNLQKGQWNKETFLNELVRTTAGVSLCYHTKLFFIWRSRKDFSELTAVQ